MTPIVINTQSIKAFEIVKQIDNFIEEYTPYVKECWDNHLNEDYPYYWPAYDYHNFLRQVEQVVKFLQANQFTNCIAYHDIIELCSEPDQAIICHHIKSRGDKIMAEEGSDLPQLVLEIGPHKLSIITL